MKLSTAGHLGLGMVLVAALAACGGGGESGPANNPNNPPQNPPAANPPTELQTSIESKFQEGLYTLTLEGLPAVGGTVTPGPGVRLYAGIQTITGPLSTTSTPVQRSIEALSTTPGLLPSFKLGAAPTPRVLVNGLVVNRNYADLEQYQMRRSGDTVVLDTLAPDNLTVHSSVRFTALEAVALPGLVVNAPTEVKTYPGYQTLFTNPLLLKPGATFLPDSKYYRRRAVRNGDLVIVVDCATKNMPTDAPSEPTPCDPATLEAAFPFNDGTRTWQMSEGAIATVNGQRRWVANTPINAGVNSFYLILIERNGAVTQGRISRDGTVVGQDSSISFHLLFNQAAFDSLRAAVNF